MQDCISKISSSRALVRPAGRIAFANGCFDILHAGHLSLLLQARSMADALVVGLNSDASVKRLKGPQRPVFAQGERAMLLAALYCVDRVIIFDDDTPEALLRELRPDMLVKGADWRGREVAGAEYAGSLVFLPLVAGRSTTSALNSIKAGEKPWPISITR